ncbi:MAG: hypothetical protein ACTSPI_11680 [Candidatus Heimdallarchaeaceae archaeon]
MNEQTKPVISEATPNIVKDGECSLCSGKTRPDKGLKNFHQYKLFFNDNTHTEIALCDKCLPKMIGTAGKEKVLQKLRNTSYLHWGDKKLR